MRRERIANGFIAFVFATLILGGMPLIPKESSLISYAATASNADRASPEGGNEVKLDNNGVYVATDAEAIDINNLTNVSLYGIEQDNTEDSIAVKVPAMIKMESYETSVDFQIEIAGTLNESSVVMVVADETVTLESVYKDPISGVVSQDRDYIESADLETGQATINGNITLDRGVSAGEWKGSFNIEVWMDSVPTEMATYSVMRVASSSNAEKAEDVTEQVSDSTESEIVEQPEEIIENKSETNELVEDSTTSEIVEENPVIYETESVIEESSTSSEENGTEEQEETEVMEMDGEFEVATPSNAMRV